MLRSRDDPPGRLPYKADIVRRVPSGPSQSVTKCPFLGKPSQVSGGPIAPEPSRHGEGNRVFVNITQDNGPTHPITLYSSEVDVRCSQRMTRNKGAGIGDLMRTTGMTRPISYRHLRAHVRTGHVVRGR